MRTPAAGEDVAGLAASPGEFLAPYQPAQRYFLLDVGGYTGSLPEGRNLMAGLIRLEYSRSPEEVEAVLAAFAEWLSGPEYRGLRRALPGKARVHSPPPRRMETMPRVHEFRSIDPKEAPNDDDVHDSRMRSLPP